MEKPVLLEQLESRLLLAATDIFNYNFNDHVFPADWTRNTSSGREWGTIGVSGVPSVPNQSGLSASVTADNSTVTSGNYGAFSYLANLTTFMEKTFDLSNFASLTLSFDTAVVTDAGDKFKVLVNGDQIASLFGSVPATTKSYDLSAYAGLGSVTIRLEFASDASVAPAAPAGVLIDNLRLSGTPASADVQPVSVNASRAFQTIRNLTIGVRNNGPDDVANKDYQFNLVLTDSANTHYMLGNYDVRNLTIASGQTVMADLSGMTITVPAAAAEGLYTLDVAISPSTTGSPGPSDPNAANNALFGTPVVVDWAGGSMSEPLSVPDCYNAAQVMHGYINSGMADTTDYYKLIIGQTGLLSVAMSGLGDNLDIQILDDQGFSVASSRASGTANETISDFSALAGKTYYVEVYPGNGTATSKYDLQFVESPPPANTVDLEVTAVNGQPENVSSVPFTPTSLSVTLRNNSPVDLVDKSFLFTFYMFSTAGASNNAGTFTANLTIPAGQTRVYTLSPAQLQSLSFSTPWGPDDCWYSARVEPSGGSVIDPNLSNNILIVGGSPIVYDKAGDTLQTARDLGDLGLGTVGATDHVSDQDIQDWYKVNLTTPGYLLVWLTGLSGKAEMEIHSSTGQMMYSATHVNSSSEVIGNYWMHPGTYYIAVVRGQVGASTSYNLSIQNAIPADKFDLSVTAFTVTPNVVQYNNQTPSAMTVTLHNNSPVDLVNQTVGMALYFTRQGLGGLGVGSMGAMVSIPAGGDLVYTVPAGQLSNLQIGNGAPDEYGLRLVLDPGNIDPDLSNNTLISGSLVHDTLANTSSQATNEGTLAAGSTTFTDAVGPLDPQDYGFFYFPGGLLSLNLAAVNNDAHVKLYNDQGTVFEGDTAALTASMPSQSLAAGWYKFAVTAKDNKLTRYDLTLSATLPRVSWSGGLSVAPTLVSRGGGTVVVNASYTIADVSPGTVEVLLFLSSDQTYSGNDWSLGYADYNQASDVQLGTHPVQIAAHAEVNIPPGAYYVVAKVRCAGGVGDAEIATATAVVNVVADATYTLSKTKKSCQITQDGHTFTLSYSGAGKADIFSPSLATNLGVGLIEITGSDAKTTLTVKSTESGARLTLPMIVGDGPMKTLDLSCVNLDDSASRGRLNVTGLVKTLKLGDVAAGADMELGGGLADKMTVNLGVVGDGAVLNSSASIGSLTAIQWDGSGQGGSTLQAPSVGSLTISGRKANAKKNVTALPGNFNVDMHLNSSNQLPAAAKALGTVKIAGDVNIAVEWDVIGNIGSISIGGTLQGEDAQTTAKIKATGNIASITAGQAEYLDVFLGDISLPNASDRHPADLAAVETQRKLGSFKVNGFKGLPLNTTFFNDVCVSAYELGTVTLKGVQLPGPADDYGLFAHVIKSMKATSIDGHNWSWPAKNLASDPSGLFNLLA